MVKIVRSDNGLEFKIDSFYASKGIEHQHTCVETPQQNEVVEHKHQHLLGVARALIFQSNLLKCFWNYVVSHVAHLINRLPTPFLHDLSPYEALFHFHPNLSHLRVFGCLAYASTITSHRKKLDPRARKCMFLGFHPGTKGFLLFDLSTRQIFVSRDVVFYENDFPYVSEAHMPESTFHTPIISHTHLLEDPFLTMSVPHDIATHTHNEPITASPTMHKPPGGSSSSTASASIDSHTHKVPHLDLN